jgi:hypothetical protein
MNQMRRRSHLVEFGRFIIEPIYQIVPVVRSLKAADGSSAKSRRVSLAEALPMNLLVPMGFMEVNETTVLNPTKQRSETPDAYP